MLPAHLSQAVYISTLEDVNVFRRAVTGTKQTKNASLKLYVCCAGRKGSYRQISYAENKQAAGAD